MTYSEYTASEKRRLRKYFNQGFKLAMADADSDRYDGQCAAIHAKAAERGAPKVAAMQRELDAAKSAVIAAQTKERIARKSWNNAEGRKVAKQARQDAETHLRTVQRAARKYNL